jgi:gas vesicle protein
MKQIDRHGDGLIPKYDFINSFKKTNVHHALRIELIEKITDVYIDNDPNVIMIQYNNLINTLCKDIKKIIENEYNHFPIEKYKYTIPKNNKRANSAYAFSLDSGNLENWAISSLSRYQNLPPINGDDVMNDINKIGKVIYFIRNNPKNSIISYLSLISKLQSYQISINKVQMIKILKFIGIQNPNAFTINELINKLNKYTICSPHGTSASMNFRPKTSFNLNKKYKTNINDFRNDKYSNYNTNQNIYSNQNINTTTPHNLKSSKSTQNLMENNTINKIKNNKNLSNI